MSTSVNVCALHIFPSIFQQKFDGFFSLYDTYIDHTYIIIQLLFSIALFIKLLTQNTHIDRDI